MYDAACTASSSTQATTRAVDALTIDRSSRVFLFSFGKAAMPMASAAVTSLLRSLHTIVGGVVVSPDGGPTPYPTLVSMKGNHPIPGRDSFAAAAKIGEFTPGRRGNDVAVVLLSGGASSLIGAPLRGMSESDLSLLYELLLGSGLDIVSMNAVRKRFSRWSAGRLALALAPAATHCLAISDVPNDDLGVIGSGPCVADATTVKEVSAILEHAGLMTRISQTHRDYLSAVTRGVIPETPTRAHPAFAHVTARVVGNNRMAVDGIAAHAESLGLSIVKSTERLRGAAARAGETIAGELVAARANGVSGRCFIWGGETTVALSSGHRPNGGGRCQELALAAARVLHDAGVSCADITLLAAGTDGRDGITDAAGAVVDGTTWSTIAASGRDPSQALAVHESYAALRAADALIAQRDTGTNVNDVVVAIV